MCIQVTSGTNGISKTATHCIELTRHPALVLKHEAQIGQITNHSNCALLNYYTSDQSNVCQASDQSNVCQASETHDVSILLVTVTVP